MLSNFLSSQASLNSLSDKGLLAVHGFSEAHGDGSLNLLVTLLSEEKLSEVWTTDDGKIETGTYKQCHWRKSNHLQFTAVSTEISDGEDYTQTTYRLYKHLLEAISSSNCHKLVRFWNYLPDINQGLGDSENYKTFCTGRLQAFSEAGIKMSDFPSASAVGHDQGGISICVVSCSPEWRLSHHANPRQVNAFQYPREYGPSSPSFARATTMELDGQKLCFISGTASILGHQSVHENDVVLQTQTSCDNILCLLDKTQFSASSPGVTLRIYLRRQQDREKCLSVLRQNFPNAQMIFLRADICREELLVEIECFCTLEQQ